MKKYLKNYFIPNESNDNQPHSLRENSIIYFLLIVVFAELLFFSALFSPIASSFKDNIAAILPGVLISSANKEREERDINQLIINPVLESAAQLKADDMAKRGFFSHTNPDGKQPWFYLEQAGYEFDSAGENLAVNFIDSKDVHKAWMKSSTHRANIVQGKFTEIGIATSRGEYKGKDVIFVAQFFAKPKAGSLNYFVDDVDKKIQDTEKLLVLDNLDLKESSIKREVRNSNVLGADTGLNENSFLNNIFSSPRSTANLILIFVFVTIYVSLIFKIFIRIKYQHKKPTLYGILLITITLSLIIFNKEVANYLGEIEGIIFEL